MKCYYHPAVDAVATCGVCNKSLCRDCFDQTDDSKCPDCSEKARIEEDIEIKAFLNDEAGYYKGSLIKALISFVIGIACGIFIFREGMFSTMSAFTESLLAIIQFGYLIMSVYLGRKIVKYFLYMFAGESSGGGLGIYVSLSTFIFIKYIFFMLKFIVYSLLGMVLAIPYLGMIGYKLYNLKKLNNNI